jgi:hypothetical protein
MLQRHDAPDSVLAAVDSAQEIQIGDLVYLVTDDARAADQVSYAAGLAQAQEDFTNQFIGVAMQRSASGDTAVIRVAINGVFEFDTASDTFEIGDLIAVAANSGADALANQAVVNLGVHTVATNERAIGRCAQREASAVTKVKVAISSVVMFGEVQSGTAST